MWTWRQYLIGLLALLVAQKGMTYPTGAPTSRCDSLTPLHGSATTQAASSNPYQLTVNVNTIEAGSKVTVTLEKKDNSAPDFKGFMIQARYEGTTDDTPADGEFTEFTTDKVKTLPCSSKNTATVTHVSNDAKSSIQLKWNHKDFFDAADKKIIFFYTVVQSADTFWAKLPHASTSLTVKAKSGSAPAESGSAESEAEAEAEAETTKHVDYAGCFESKGCFGMPSGCEAKGDCKVMVSYKKENEDKFMMSIHGRNVASGGYLAMGLSQDSSMGSDLVFYCKVASPTQPKIGWNVASGKNNVVGVTGISLTPESSKTESGITTCQFSVPSKLTGLTSPNGDTIPDYDLINGSYHVLVATGPMSGDSLTIHTEKQASSSPVNLVQFEKVKSKGDIMMKLHGALMVLAWMGSASCGMFFARYMKETWKKQKFMGKDIWYPVHVGHMFLTVCLTLIAFIIIASDKGFHPFTAAGIKENPHPVFGIITIVTCFMNPVMAAIRPHPTANLRWVFNWAHWLVGNVAWLFGIIAIFLAGDLKAITFVPPHDYTVMIFVSASFSSRGFFFLNT